MMTLCRLLCILAACVLTAWAAAAPPPPSGNWHGQLATPAGKLTLLVNIRSSPDASLSGDLESIDQAPGQKIPLAAVTAAADRLAFAVPAIGASYEGRWQDDQQAWVGVFKQSIAFPLTLRAGLPPAKPGIAGMDGQWRALLVRDNASLHLILHVATSQGATHVTLDSPDLGAFGLVVERFERDGDSVRFEIPAASVRFVGKLDGERRQLQGQWTRQGLAPATVQFERDATEAAPQARSQWPLPSIPYRSEDLCFPNPDAAGVVLAGTLTLPQGAGPFAAAILISGSGPQDRDETMYGHKPFAVLADALTRRGIAVLRYDDRGYAGSSGSFEQATSADFASDASAAVGYLLGRAEIDRHAIGFIGHSEGGMVGPLAAVDNASVAFVILLAGPGVGIDQLLLSQRRLAALAQGVAPAQVASQEVIWRDLFQLARSTADGEDRARRVQQRLTPEMAQALGLSAAQCAQLEQQLRSAWMHYLLNYEPGAILARIHVPVLALNGTLDQQVAASANLAAIRMALASNPDATVEELPGLNHLFQPAITGAVGEYARIETTLATPALDTITAWLTERFVRADDRCAGFTPHSIAAAGCGSGR
ncbi:alpha/beta fold hydrolase [Duganella sp. FT135W]|uniref:Alpha/beta fold hydrolase n=1 Tax=Duganella flavida TaxID=2692175 RepID=A0A6L8KAI8_9BURK|nr:alpha/beta fold hydrolase [Duganella flavida]MYM22874.1 alpha/beta fold hydrolase [Duganella flavida]